MRNRSFGRNHATYLGGRFGRASSGLVIGVGLLLAGCQQKMAEQPSYRPMQPCSFFPDGQSTRPIVAGTVARGHLRSDGPLYTGRRPEAVGRPLVLRRPFPAGRGNPSAKEIE